MAGVDHPDSAGSAGSDFLVSVRDAVAEAWDNGDDLDPDGVIADEIAEGAVPVYTHARMLAMVDVCAYKEDLDGMTGDLIDLAGVALKQVAERLVRALAEKLADDQTD
jgi:hypothetical protein